MRDVAAERRDIDQAIKGKTLCSVFARWAISANAFFGSKKTPDNRENSLSPAGWGSIAMELSGVVQT